MWLGCLQTAVLRVKCRWQQCVKADPVIQPPHAASVTEPVKTNMVFLPVSRSMHCLHSKQAPPLCMGSFQQKGWSANL